MTALASSRTRPRRFWGDARFILGILLIAVSVAGVWLVVSSARQTVPVLAASRTLVPGEPVAAGDLRVIDVALGQAGETYVRSGALADGAVVTRTVGEGELLPATAVGPAADARVARVMVDSVADVPASVSAGSRVEVWTAPLIEPQVFDTPRILVAEATVAEVTREQGMLGSARASLELVIPRADVADTLRAMTDGSTLSVVPLVGVGG